ncbi:MAG: cobalamin biosynthesis protein CobW [Hyphomicrobium sp.]|nr:MAG: cobalamin biosynthesis protein CobW [Hyphomicrobium sp.]PPC98285.1 MAG: cobalamin biosynthesis protein CobW [Hyphomicrobium sp.]
MAQPAMTTSFTIITGFLGAGKTTLLNEMLCGSHGRRMAVIINEFGAVNIDSQLIARRVGDGILELTNGCVCCTVRDDLRTGLQALLDSRDRGELAFEHIVMETTGLAKVGPIIQTLSIKTLKSAIHLGGVVTVVDASNILVQLNRFHEAGEQIGHADLLLLNKIDLVDEEAIARLQMRLTAINGMAKILIRQGTSDTMAEIFDLPVARRSDAEVIAFETSTGNVQRHAHLDQVRSFVVQLSAPLDQGQVQDWFSYLIMRHTERLLRYKGILNFEGIEKRVVLQGVHGLLEIRADRDWLPAETRMTTVVFIGKDLPEQDFREGLTRCIATRDPAAQFI